MTRWSGLLPNYFTHLTLLKFSAFVQLHLCLPFELFFTGLIQTFFSGIASLQELTDTSKLYT